MVVTEFEGYQFFFPLLPSTSGLCAMSVTEMMDFSGKNTHKCEEPGDSTHKLLPLQGWPLGWLWDKEIV